MRLYTYWRSSAAWRVRIALNLKNITYDSEIVNIVRGDQCTDAYRAINPNSVVPTLQLNDGTVLTQSLAIIEYLEEQYPSPPLLPTDPILRARVRAAAQQVACDIHPINNLRVVGQLKLRLGRSPEDATEWMRHWMRMGLQSYLQLIDNDGLFSFGKSPTLADLCLIPQLYNARRWGVDFTGFERFAKITGAAEAIPAFQAAVPQAQPDAESKAL